MVELCVRPREAVWNFYNLVCIFFGTTINGHFACLNVDEVLTSTAPVKQLHLSAQAVKASLVDNRHLMSWCKQPFSPTLSYINKIINSITNCELLLNIDQIPTKNIFPIKRIPHCFWVEVNKDGCIYVIIIQLVLCGYAFLFVDENCNEWAL